MSFVHRAACHADPADAWALIARPGRWHEWAPHVRGAWGLGQPEVEEGRRGFVRLLGVVPVPAVITAVEPPRSWTWRTGPLTIEHRVLATDEGCVVEVEGSAIGAVEQLVALTYGPLVDLLTKNLARVAANSRE